MSLSLLSFSEDIYDRFYKFSVDYFINDNLFLQIPQKSYGRVTAVYDVHCCGMPNMSYSERLIFTVWEVH